MLSSDLDHKSLEAIWVDLIIKIQNQLLWVQPIDLLTKLILSNNTMMEQEFISAGDLNTNVACKTSNNLCKGLKSIYVLVLV